MTPMSLPDKRDHVSHRAPRLLWQQVYDDVISDIRSGALAVDDRLPSELDMAEQYGVSRDVIRRAKKSWPGKAGLSCSTAAARSSLALTQVAATRPRLRPVRAADAGPDGSRAS